MKSDASSRLADLVLIKFWLKPAGQKTLFYNMSKRGILT